MRARILLLFILGTALPAAAQELTGQVRGRYFLRYVFLNAITSPTTGTWVNIEGYSNSSVIVKGIGTGTCKLYLSNDAAKPADASTFSEAASVTQDSVIQFATPARWARFGCTALTAGTVTATLESLQ